MLSFALISIFISSACFLSGAALTCHHCTTEDCELESVAKINCTGKCALFVGLVIDDDAIYPPLVDAFCASSQYVQMYKPGCNSFKNIRQYYYEKFCLQYCDTPMFNNPDSDPIRRGSFGVLDNTENFLN